MGEQFHVRMESIGDVNVSLSSPQYLRLLSLCTAVKIKPQTECINIDDEIDDQRSVLLPRTGSNNANNNANIHPKKRPKIHKRFKVLSDKDEEILLATELSVVSDRWCYGSRRPLELHVVTKDMHQAPPVLLHHAGNDNDQHDDDSYIQLRPYLRLVRPRNWMMKHQEMQVYDPDTGTLLGTVVREPSKPKAPACFCQPILCSRLFIVNDQHGDPLYRISGAWPLCCSSRPPKFYIRNAVEVNPPDFEDEGVITSAPAPTSKVAKQKGAKRDEVVMAFPVGTPLPHKALLIGACFLIILLHFDRDPLNSHYQQKRPWTRANPNLIRTLSPMPTSPTTMRVSPPKHLQEQQQPEPPPQQPQHPNLVPGEEDQEEQEQQRGNAAQHHDDHHDDEHLLLDHQHHRHHQHQHLNNDSDEVEAFESNELLTASSANLTTSPAFSSNNTVESQHSSTMDSNSSSRRNSEGLYNREPSPFDGLDDPR